MRKAFHGYILIAPVMIGPPFTLIPFGIVLRYSFTQGNYGAAACSSAWSIIRRCSKTTFFRLAFFNTMNRLAISCCFPTFWRSSCKSRRASIRLKSVFCFRTSCLLIDLLSAKKGAVNGLFAALNLPIVEWLDGNTRSGS